MSRDVSVRIGVPVGLLLPRRAGPRDRAGNRMNGWATAHIGRSFVGHPLEDDCPCGKAPCGLVDVSRIHPSCPQHAMRAAKTIRQSHWASNCPDRSQATPVTDPQEGQA